MAELNEEIDSISAKLLIRDGEVKFLKSRLESPRYTSLEDAAVTLTRHLLNSIDLEDARPKVTMTPEERKEYVARMASNFDLMDRFLKRLIIAQEEAMARGSAELSDVSRDPVQQTMFGRGTMNGLMLIHEELEGYYKEHLANIEPTPPFDRTKLFPESR